MQSRILFVVLLLGLVAYVSAATTPIQKRSFKVDRVRNHRFTGRDADSGPRALVQAYGKYGMEMPDSLKAYLAAKTKAAKTPVRRSGGPRRDGGPRRAEGLSSRGLFDIVGAGVDRHGQNDQQDPQGQQDQEQGTITGSVVNIPEHNDIEFVSPVKIGGQSLNLDFDTGSSDLWVISSMLPFNVTEGHLVYDPEDSDDFELLEGALFGLSYGDGSFAAGVVGTDVVEVGDAIFPKQAVELAKHISDSFVNDKVKDGLMGLAFSKLNSVTPQKQNTFFDNIRDSLVLPVFTVDLRKGTTGRYQFGEIDYSKFTGDLTEVQVNDTAGFWQFSSESFAINGGKPQVVAPGGHAIADTGTTLLIAAPAIVNGYYSQIPGAIDNPEAGGFTFPCNSTLPDLDLDIGGAYMATVKGEDLNFATVSNTTCFGGLQPSNNSFGIYGDIFFKSQFVVFNNLAKTLSLAEHA